MYDKDYEINSRTDNKSILNFPLLVNSNSLCSHHFRHRHFRIASDTSGLIGINFRISFGSAISFISVSPYSSHFRHGGVLLATLRVKQITKKTENKYRSRFCMFFFSVVFLFLVLFFV